MTITDATAAPTHALDATERWQVGRVTITKFVEMAVAIPGEMLMPEATADVVLRHRADLGPHATDAGQLSFGIHGFVLDDGEHRVLVDGGIGNAKSRPEPWFDDLDTPALATMAAAGYPPDVIDTVIATHLHADHIGWFTVASGDGDHERWTPTFPHARHLVVRDELVHWQSSADPDVVGAFQDSVHPVLAAALVDRVAPDHAVTDEIRLVPTPGHSPGHVSVLIESEGEAAVITGDLMHHPIQVLEPRWHGPFDEDVTTAASTRSAFFARFADTDTLVLGTHVATPTGGRIVTTATGWRWVPVSDAVGVDAARSIEKGGPVAGGRGAGAYGRAVGDERRTRFRFWAEGYEAVLRLSELVRASGIEPELLELVKLRASQLNGCAYCIDMHSKDARAAGETEQRLYALSAWRETPFFTDRERSALALTESVTLVAETHVPDSVVEEAAAHFGRDELAKLVYAIVEINAWNRMAITFGAPEPGSYEPPDG